MNTESRKDVLLKAAYDILSQCEESPVVENVMELTTLYDEEECDGYCLMNDIADVLDCEASDADETDDSLNDASIQEKLQTLFTRVAHVAALAEKEKNRHAYRVEGLPFEEMIKSFEELFDNMIDFHYKEERV